MIYLITRKNLNEPGLLEDVRVVAKEAMKILEVPTAKQKKYVAML